MSDASLLTAVLDELVERFGGDDYAGEIARARDEFEQRRGRVFEDEPLWEPWTQAFLEWYVLERVMAGHDVPPAGIALAAERDAGRAAALRALLTSLRSLFEWRGLDVGEVALVDLIGGGEYEVDEQRALHGVERGDVVEARLVGLRSRVSFARTFWYHPAGTRDSIAAHVARMRGEGADRRSIIDFVASLRVRCLRYQHMTAERVYSPDARRPS